MIVKIQEKRTKHIYFQGKANNTIHYIIQMTFKEERKIEILENNSRVEIKKKV